MQPGVSHIRMIIFANVCFSASLGATRWALQSDGVSVSSGHQCSLVVNLLVIVAPFDHEI
jgi:hypothetical protein